jgi:sulfite reductase (NADPH) flavoprotein alpha-component
MLEHIAGRLSSSPEALACLAVVVVLAACWLLGRVLTARPAPAAAAVASADAPVAILYASQKGHGKRFADRLVVAASARGYRAVATDLAGFDADTLVHHPLIVFVVATYAGGSAVPGTAPFFDELSEMSRDFRVEKTLLGSTAYAVFGCGNSEYPKKDFNAVARRLDRAMRLLGARRLAARCEGDDVDVRRRPRAAARRAATPAERACRHAPRRPLLPSALDRARPSDPRPPLARPAAECAERTV